MLPIAVAVGGLTTLLWGWDASRTMTGAICLSIASWLIPTIGAVAYTALTETNQPDAHSSKTNPVVVGITCIFATLVVGVFSSLILVVAGWVTRTESPTSQQVTHAREFLLINPELEIQPLAYYVKDGMDYMVRFKFLAKTDDPAQIFDRARVDPAALAPNFDFPPGEDGTTKLGGTFPRVRCQVDTSASRMIAP